MTPFVLHHGITAYFNQDNIDTDQIIPSREMKTVSKTGLADGLFAGQRYTEGRKPNPNFILNQAGYKNATIVLAGQNFGCGSSREHAVWALKDYGFRAIIAQSFGEIFYNNCVRNGILPIQMDAKEIASLGQEVTINLPNQKVDDVPFDIPPSDKKMLVEGLDMIDQSLVHQRDIDDFFRRDRISRAWKY